MARYTPNFNLYEPDTTDDFADFRTEFNNNMDIIDQNLGGGGGSGGHTIIDENDTPMTQRTGLQFTGNVQVTDDSVNDKTIVDVLGGGGNVYGAFIDTDRVIASGSFAGSFSYTATEDSFVVVGIVSDNSSEGKIYVDGVVYTSLYNTGGSSVHENMNVYLRKGQVMSITEGNGGWTVSYAVYGLKQGTNGIYAPVIYSDNERVIGVWRDNKPLYQRTFDLGSDLSISYSAWVSSGVTLTNVENLIKAYGTRSDNSFQGYVLAWNDNTDLKLTTPRNGNNSFIRYLTLQYTKTTDVAGSGNWNTDGVPTHHYSTNEQVVGTWINNKPLYEKTFEHSGALIVDNSFANDIGSLVSVDQFIGCEGYFRRTNANGLMYSLNGGTRPEGSADNKVSARYYNGNVQVAVNGYNDIEYIALTVRYTKSTD